MGLLSLKKVFDRIDHSYAFKTLSAFGLGDNFVSWVKLLYTGVSAMLKVGGGLSYPVKVHRGIRQGCPISGQLMSLAVEPLLCRLRANQQGLSVQRA